MNIEEFNKVKDFTYREYCKYLQNKYGIPKEGYFTKNLSQNHYIKRTDEGLYIHHICEDMAEKLCTPEETIKNSYPMAWQDPENLCYCDLLGHLFLHVLILKYPNPEQITKYVSRGGLFVYLIPEINDGYAGFPWAQNYRKISHEKIANDYEVYLKIIEFLFEIEKDKNPMVLFQCEKGLAWDGYKGWDTKKLQKIFDDFEDIYYKDNKFDNKEKKTILSFFKKFFHLDKSV